jgi:hypothetical protein
MSIARIPAHPNRTIAGWAALLLAAVAIANALVVGVGLGAYALDQRALAANALAMRGPLLTLEILKIVAAALGALLVSSTAAILRPGRAGQVAGAIAAALLLAAGALGLYALLAPDQELGRIVSPVGLASLFLNGIWYLAAGRASLREALLPRPLAILTVLIGALSLIPLLALLILPLNLAWSIWLAATLLRSPSGNTKPIAE